MRERNTPPAEQYAQQFSPQLPIRSSEGCLFCIVSASLVRISKRSRHLAKHRAIIHQSPVPFARRSPIEGTFDITFQAFIRYLGALRKEKMDENAADVGFNEYFRLVPNKCTERSRCPRPDSRQFLKFRPLAR